MPGKPKVHIDQDGDGDVDVTVDVETPDPQPGTWPAGVREKINLLVGSMEVSLPAGTQRATYSQVREALRTLLNNNPA